MDLFLLILSAILIISGIIGSFIPIIRLLVTLDIKSRNLNLNKLIGFFEVIKRYLLSCKAIFQSALPKQLPDTRNLNSARPKWAKT